MSDDEAYQAFVSVRFAENGGEPFCPWCGHREVYEIGTRRKWKCAAKRCRRQFSATSGTVFASRKLPFRKILMTIVHFVMAAKDVSAIQMCLRLRVSYKTAFVLQHKLREVLGNHQHSTTLRGGIEIDGAYFNRHVRPRNDRSARADRRLIWNRPSKAHCVTVVRERGGRSRAFLKSEAEIAKMVPQIVEPGSIIYTDAAPEYNRLAARYVLKMINHSERYADGDKSTNWAESFFARLRRMQRGTYHRMAGVYLGAYLNEGSWREDTRRRTMRENYEGVLGLATHHPVSREWKGYWQRWQRSKAAA